MNEPEYIARLREFKRMYLANGGEMTEELADALNLLRDHDFWKRRAEANQRVADETKRYAVWRADVMTKNSLSLGSCDDADHDAARWQWFRERVDRIVFQTAIDTHENVTRIESLIVIPINSFPIIPTTVDDAFDTAMAADDAGIS